MLKLLLSQIQSGRPSTDAETKLQACGWGLLETTWLWPSLDHALLELFKDWPSVADMKYLHSIRDLTRLATAGDMSEVSRKVDGYVVDCLVRRGTINTDTRILVKALMTLWQRAPDSDRRLLALSVVQGRVISTNLMSLLGSATTTTRWLRSQSSGHYTELRSSSSCSVR